MHESSAIHALSSCLTPEDRAELHQRITTAVFGLDTWRRSGVERDDLDDEIIDVVDEHLRSNGENLCGEICFSICFDIV